MQKVCFNFMQRYKKKLDFWILDFRFLLNNQKKLELPKNQTKKLNFKSSRCQKSL